MFYVINGGPDAALKVALDDGLNVGREWGHLRVLFRSN